MHPYLNRAAAVTAAVLVGAGAAVVPLSAASAAPTSVSHYDRTEPAQTFTFECGAVWTTSLEAKGTFRQLPDGTYRIIEHDFFPGTITYHGRTYTANDHQVDISTVAPDFSPVGPGMLNGQGLFTHIPGIGVVVHDNGHLLFDDASGTTIKASAKVIPLDQSFDYGAAVCAALTSR